MNFIFYTLTAWNIIIFAVYGIDKWKSKYNKWRVKEATLIWAAFFMGGIGAMIGMSVFHHKTTKKKFKALVPLAAVLNNLFVIGGIYIAKRYL